MIQIENQLNNLTNILNFTPKVPIFEQKSLSITSTHFASQYFLYQYNYKTL